MTAQEARAISTTADSGRITQQMKRIEADIEIVAREGLFSVTVYSRSLSIQVKQELERRGFKVTTGFDQRDGDSWVTISW